MYCFSNSLASSFVSQVANVVLEKFSRPYFFIASCKILPLPK
nr:MAG TPA: hypothetical protein [Caudoviricetes sp.]